MSGSRQGLSGLRAAALYFEFAVTGTVTTLLGPMIPLLLKSCSLTDAHAGALVAAQFIGNVTGALFSTRNLVASIYTGVPLIAVGVGALTFVPCHWLYACVACYGVGLGLTISATNLVVAGHHTARRASVLNLTNFLWGAGAVASPILVGWAHREQVLRQCVLALAVLNALLWAVILVLKVSPSQKPESGIDKGYSASLLFISALLFLYIGVETSMGSWTALFADRLTHNTEWMAFFSVAAFWAVLLAGRLASAVLLRYLPESVVYAASLGFVLSGNGLLLAARSGVQVLVGASVTALGLAPLFPLILSIASGALLASRSSGWVFSVAALGGAALPWLAGQVSTWSGSLRAAFAVPAIAAILIGILSIAASRHGYFAALRLSSRSAGVTN